MEQPLLEFGGKGNAFTHCHAPLGVDIFFDLDEFVI